jgi:Asp-tRNA(Asn)/Glu-tRNA(Gln) amidotransferase A subunit family amidase
MVEPQSLKLGELRIALCETPMWKEATPDAQEALHLAASLLAKAGVKITSLTLSEPFARLTEQQDAIMHEAGRGAFLPEYIRAGHQLHEDFRSKVENKRGFTAEQMRAVFDQTALRRIDFEKEMGEFDAVMTLSAPGEAPHGLESQGEATFNRMFTALHVPCISVPGMKGRSGLPIGIQLIQRRYEDEMLLKVAAAVATVIDPAARGA